MLDMKLLDRIQQLEANFFSQTFENATRLYVGEEEYEQLILRQNSMSGISSEAILKYGGLEIVKVSKLNFLSVGF